jgi:integrase
MLFCSTAIRVCGPHRRESQRAADGSGGPWCTTTRLISLRRTKAAIIYKQTGNLRAVQILLGHTKIESTVRYLGVDVEGALALAEGTEA